MNVRVVMLINRWLIAIFGIASGLYKVAGGQADIDLFAPLGITPMAVAVFGAVQAAAGAALLMPRFQVLGAIVLAAANMLGTVGLFVADVQPFGIISVLFVAMALLAGRRVP